MIPSNAASPCDPAFLLRVSYRTTCQAAQCKRSPRENYTRATRQDSDIAKHQRVIVAYVPYTGQERHDGPVCLFGYPPAICWHVPGSHTSGTSRQPRNATRCVARTYSIRNETRTVDHMASESRGALHSDRLRTAPTSNTWVRHRICHLHLTSDVPRALPKRVQRPLIRSPVMSCSRRRHPTRRYLLAV